jgi:PTS system mannose-specific IIB component
MNIVLARIDDRLIHGQVVTVWTRETRCERIIVCNDDADADPIRKALLTQTAPPGVVANVVNIEKAIRVCQNPKYDGVRALLLFTNPTDVVRMIEGGIEIKTVNIGGMCFKEGKRQITKAVSVDETDIAAFKNMHEKGVELEIRKVASDSKIDLMSVL